MEKNVIYVESWSPKYENRDTVKHWFNEWNTRGKVLKWEIKQYFHKDNKIEFLKEFGCNLNNYNPYKNNNTPIVKQGFN